MLKFNLARKSNLVEVFQRAAVPSVVLDRVDPSRRIRMAVGWLGLPDEEQNRRAGDLVVADLSSEANLELVDRQSLAAVLREAALGLSGLVRADSAVRVGKLLRADWFLLGTSASINGHQYILARLVDARTGALRDLTALPNDQGPLRLAASVADFVRQSRHNASAGGRRTLVALGGFLDVSVNAHQAGFGNQLRAHLLASFQGSPNVVILERECVDLLLQEVRLDLAGMTEPSGSNSTDRMLTAMWMVEGTYQSYEARGQGVELDLTVAQAFGMQSTTTLRGAPDEALFAQASKVVNQALSTDQLLKTPTRLSENQFAMLRGNQVSRLDKNTFAFDYPPLTSLFLTGQKLEEAIRSYQTALLLEPTNRLARLYLARCLENVDAPEKLEEGRSYLRELAESPVHDHTTFAAMKGLAWSYRNEDDAEAEKWFRKAALLVTNNDPLTKGSLLFEAEDIADEIASRNRPNPTGAEMAEDQFRKRIRRMSDEAGVARTSPSGVAFDEFLGSFGADHTAGVQRLNEILPELTRKYTNIAPHLIVHAFIRQPGTNNPFMAELLGTTESCAQHPDQMAFPSIYFPMVSPVATTWCVEHSNYSVVPRLMEAKRVAIANDTDSKGGMYYRYPPKTPTMNLSDVKLLVEENMVLARAWIGLERWKDALDILESFPSWPVAITDSSKPWLKGTIPGLPSDLAALCRRKLGLPAAPPDPRLFSLADSLIGFDSGLSFTTCPDGLWLAGGGKLLQLDFGLATNLDVRLPYQGVIPAFVCAGASQVFVATAGAGLIEYNKTTRKCRQWTEKDGLYSDAVQCLCLQGDTLWIGYGSDWRGGAAGIGRMDLPTGRLTAFTPSVSSSLAGRDPSTQAPRTLVLSLAAGPDGDMFVSSRNKGVQRYHAREDRWDMVTNSAPPCVACNATTLFIPYGYMTMDGWGKNLQPLRLQTLSDGHWEGFGKEAGLPQPTASAIALDGQDIWLGGRGFIGVINPAQKTMRKFCYTQIAEVYHMEVAGGWVWVQLRGSLFRIPLSVAQ
jgi:tetratricopeptide (TPR) repeat protein